MSHDLRKYARQTQLRLFVGGVLIFIVVGDGLIYLFYGRNAAITGLICMISVLSPILLIWLLLAAIAWIINRQ